jgi:uncharacterized membrane protein YccC
MSTESQPARRPLTASRILIRLVATIVGIIVGLFLFFLCADMFVGYPQYGTEYMSWVGVALIIATGGVVFIIDHRRLDADD